VKQFVNFDEIWQVEPSQALVGTMCQMLKLLELSLEESEFVTSSMACTQTSFFSFFWFRL